MLLFYVFFGLRYTDWKVYELLHIPFFFFFGYDADLYTIWHKTLNCPFQIKTCAGFYGGKHHFIQEFKFTYMLPWSVLSYWKFVNLINRINYLEGILFKCSKYPILMVVRDHHLTAKIPLALTSCILNMLVANYQAISGWTSTWNQILLFDLKKAGQGEGKN